MKLKEIKGLFEMDFGAPSPTVLSNDNELILIFYADSDEKTLALKERNIIYDKGIIVLKFKNYLKYTFGLPGDETIEGHPYRKFGLNSYMFCEVEESDFIMSLQNIDKVHPYYNPEKWKFYKHYIITFHDNMFECVALDFEIREENISIYNEVSSIMNELSLKNL